MMLSFILLCYLSLVSITNAAQPPRYWPRHDKSYQRASSACSTKLGHSKLPFSTASDPPVCTKWVTISPSKKVVTSTKVVTKTKVVTEAACHNAFLSTHGTITASPPSTGTPISFLSTSIISVHSTAALHNTTESLSLSSSGSTLAANTSSAIDLSLSTSNNASLTSAGSSSSIGSQSSPLSSATSAVVPSAESVTTNTAISTSLGESLSSSADSSSASATSPLSSVIVWSSSMISVSPSQAPSSSSSSFSFSLPTPSISSVSISSPISFSASTLLSVTTINPSASATLSSAPEAPSFSGCGAVSVYYGQTPQDWINNNLDVWLNDWIIKHAPEIAVNPYGFTGAFASWAIGNPDFSCRDDGSNSACDFNPCDITVLNHRGSDIREAYYVMESINRIHAYFMGMREGFEVSAIGSALSKDDWATTFYRDKDVKQVAALREVLNAIQMVVGLGGAMAGLAGPAGMAITAVTTSTTLMSGALVGAAGSAAGVLFAGGVGAALPLIGQHQDDTFNKAADLGGILGQVVVGAIQSYTAVNNMLMFGQNYNGDLRDYFRNGTFVAYPGVDKNAVTNAMNAFLVGHAINQLYRQQKIFILGGGACGDNQGIGTGPQEFGFCDKDNRAWYLYFWEETHKIVLNAKKWGWMAMPPGADQLNQGAYVGITVQNLISSSVDAFKVAGYDYNSAIATARVQDALTNQWGNPAASGPAWEGVFTIPVCDISAMIGTETPGKEYIMMPYSYNNRPHWCGPICGGNLDQTRAFIHAANMDNFKSPKHYCPGQQGY